MFDTKKYQRLSLITLEGCNTSRSTTQHYCEPEVVYIEQQKPSFSPFKVFVLASAMNQIYSTPQIDPDLSSWYPYDDGGLPGL